MEGGAAHRYLGEDGQQQRQDRQVHANPLASVALLNIFRHGDDLGRHRGQELSTPPRSHPAVRAQSFSRARPDPHTHYHPTTGDGD